MTNIFNAIIIHFDEIGLKGRNQRFFVKRLVDAIQKKLGVSVKLGAKKLIVRVQPDSHIEEYLEKLKLIPGISHFSPAIIGKSDWEGIQSMAFQLMQYVSPKTFKVSTRRAYKLFPKNSQEVCRDLGAAILEKFSDLKVDIKNPKLMLKVEIEKDHSAVLGERIEGVGGFAVGSSGKMMSLLSGGIDSPVASFLMMKRGVKVKFIHFHNQTINKSGVEDKIKDLVKRLSEIQGESTLFIVPFADLQKEVIAKIPADLRMIVYRRLMFRIAEAVARKEKGQALITGDSLAQVASQTLENMNVIYESTDMLKLSPLIGLNKIEITKIAQQIGTYDISIRPYEDCCSLLIAKHPETKASLRNVLEVEKELDILKLIDSAVKSIKEYKL